MTKKIFTSRKLDTLTIKPFVKPMSLKGITYTDEFKEIFLAQIMEGKFPAETM